MQQLQMRLAVPEEKVAILSFMDRYWGEAHPLLHRQDLFSYYYETGSGINFALALTAEADCPVRAEDILAVCGYLPANQQCSAIWLSLLQASPKAKGAGMVLVSEIGRLTGAKLVCCNNIRPSTLSVYRFLGYSADKMTHCYRLKALPEEQQQPGTAFHLAVIKQYRHPTVPAKEFYEEVTLSDIAREFVFPKDRYPQKDLWYLTRRYETFAQQIAGGYQYRFYGLRRGGSMTALLVTRYNETPLGNALRIVDYIGSDVDFAQVGGTVDALLCRYRAEYADMYCVGLTMETVAAAGFSVRDEQDENIIPNYLNPPLQENIDFYYFTEDPDGFVMFRADGDQDRPNLEIQETPL